MKLIVVSFVAIIFGCLDIGALTEESCGTFVSYNPRTDPKQPEVDGFAAGIYLDGSVAYVGIGDGVECQQPGMPARISTENTFKGPGAYSSCWNEQFDDVNSKYLLRNSKLNWVEPLAIAAINVPGAISIFESNFKYFIGRINITLDNGTSYTQVSKIHSDGDAAGMWYMTPSGERKTTTGFEILACFKDAGSAASSTPWELYTSNAWPETTATPAPTTTAGNCPTDTLCKGQCLKRDERIYSNSGCYYLKMQIDGNLVLYQKSPERALWATRTDVTDATMACLQSDGNFVLYNNLHQPRFNTQTPDTSSDQLVVQDDGNMILYASNRITFYWQTNTWQRVPILNC